MPFVFRVSVPFQPFVHETLDSTVQAELPEQDLAAGLSIRKSADNEYVAILEIRSNHPRSAKVEAIACVEGFLKVLATWNQSFTVRVGGVTAEKIQDETSAVTVNEHEGVKAVYATDVLHFEEHVGIVVKKANLDAEDSALQSFSSLPEVVRNCLDINYLLVISDRPPVRWLLAATGLEALAVGIMGPQPTLDTRMTKDSKRTLRADLDAALLSAGVTVQEDRERALVNRIPTTTLEPVGVHVHRYLAMVGIHDVTVEQCKRWWKVRSEIAHGSAVSINTSQLNELATTFQTALRRQAGVESLRS